MSATPSSVGQIIADKITVAQQLATVDSTGVVNYAAALLLQKRDLLAGRHLTSGHCVAVRQMQWGDGVVGQ